MAEVLEEMPRIKRPGRRVKYPYDEWFAMALENPVKLSRGDDFDVEVKTMRHNLYRHSKDRNLGIETVTLGEENDPDASIVIRVTNENKNNQNGSTK